MRLRRWLLGWLCVWLGVLGATAHAQSFGLDGLETHASLSFSSALALRSPLASGFWGTTAHLEARYVIHDLQLELMLDPAVRFSPNAVTFEPGITQAAALWRLGEFDLSLGLERLPLEASRLSLPYLLEPVDALGRRLGIPGLRLSWNPAQTRLRLGLLWLEGVPVPLLSLRREFEVFELEVHALYRAGRAVFGASGSGTLENLVLYGEAWLITAPLETRFALGASGTLGDGLWTLEAGYASPTAGTLPRRLFAGQYGLPILEDTSFTVNTALYFDDDAVRGGLNLALTQSTDDAELSFALGLQFGAPGAVWTFGLQLRGFLW